MSDRRRVLITGIGLITAVGTGRDAFRAGLRRGSSPIKRIDRFDPSPFRSQVAAQVDDFDPLAWMPPKTARQLDRFSQFGLVAGRLAMDDAGLRPGEGGAASATGGDLPRQRPRRDRLRRGPARAVTSSGGSRRRPEPRPRGLRRGGAGQPRDRAGRPRADPVDRQLLRVRRRRPRRGAQGDPVGEIDAAIAGGAEAPLSPLAFGAFDIIRALSDGRNDDPSHACRPFDARARRLRHGRRRGLPRPRGGGGRPARGAEPYAEILGYGATSDAFHMVQPRADGPEAGRAATIALADAGVAADEIDWVSAHASSTPLGDIAEARAIRLALGERADDRAGQRDEGAVRPPARGVGGDRGRDLRPGHPRRLGPGLGEPRPSPSPRSTRFCRASSGGRDGTYRRILSTSFGFGGLNAALVFGEIGG